MTTTNGELRARINGQIERLSDQPLGPSERLLIATLVEPWALARGLEPGRMDAWTTQELTDLLRELRSRS